MPGIYGCLNRKSNRLEEVFAPLCPTYLNSKKANVEQYCPKELIRNLMSEGENLGRWRFQTNGNGCKCDYPEFYGSSMWSNKV